MTTPVATSGIILGGNATRLWGMSASERLRRGLLRVGVTTITDDLAARAEQGAVLLVSNHWVFDEPLLTALSKASNTLLIDTASGKVIAAQVSAVDAGHVGAVIEAGSGIEALPAHLQSRDVAGVAGNYNDALRKRELPYVLKLTPETRVAVERRMFEGSYKE